MNHRLNKDLSALLDDALQVRVDMQNHPDVFEIETMLVDLRHELNSALASLETEFTSRECDADALMHLIRAVREIEDRHFKLCSEFMTLLIDETQPPPLVSDSETSSIESDAWFNPDIDNDEIPPLNEYHSEDDQLHTVPKTVQKTTRFVGDPHAVAAAEQEQRSGSQARWVTHEAASSEQLAHRLQCVDNAVHNPESLGYTLDVDIDRYHDIHQNRDHDRDHNDDKDDDRDRDPDLDGPPDDSEAGAAVTVRGVVSV